MGKVVHIDFRKLPRSTPMQMAFLRARNGAVEIEIGCIQYVLELTPDQARAWSDALEQLATSADTQAEGNGAK